MFSNKEDITEFWSNVELVIRKKKWRKAGYQKGEEVWNSGVEEVIISNESKDCL